jgi:pheromone shutdown protein TraB
MRAKIIFLRASGWLLTPIVALAASFVGALLGTVLAALLANPLHGVALTVALGGVAGYVTVHYWLRALRHSPRLQHALHVLPDGTPEVAAMDDAPPSEGGEPE